MFSVLAGELLRAMRLEGDSRGRCDAAGAHEDVDHREPCAAAAEARGVRLRPRRAGGCRQSLRPGARAGLPSAESWTVGLGHRRIIRVVCGLRNGRRTCAQPVGAPPTARGTLDGIRPFSR